MDPNCCFKGFEGKQGKGPFCLWQYQDRVESRLPGYIVMLGQMGKSVSLFDMLAMSCFTGVI